ncbi:chondroitin synthase [Ruminiclostridium hungatei]|uniref:Chondroitin synthase n=1 Tax=Ruminiclostridium hungatei TaxID=48256 RepID=A0A1V4SEQ2_RUMHU|nr:glycosyltransferase [Ruminiclostridium hungatei]OPX42330.1 chondroitin synthase [Ruminiclostridium hungatei]
MKRFSFVIPTYQGKKLVKNTLEALNYQEGYYSKDYEVILVDDGSTDGTGEHIKGVNRNYHMKYIYIERNAESSRAKARNQGWKAAEGEIIIFIDGDILVKKDYLMELDRCYGLDKDILVIGNRIMLGEDLSYESVLNRTAMEGRIFSMDRRSQLESRYYKYYRFSYNINYQLYPWLDVFSCNMAVPRSWLERTGGFDESFKGWGLEDVEVGYNMYKKGIKIVLNSKLEVFHQNHPGSDSLKLSKKKYGDIDKNIGHFLKKHPEAFTASENLIYKVLKGLAEIDLTPRKKLFSKRVTLDFMDKSTLADLKRTVMEYSAQKDIRLKIIDHLEETDLDIWVQLLGKRESTPQYVPVSKRKEFRRLLGFTRRLIYWCFVAKRLLLKSLSRGQTYLASHEWVTD